ncbi:hypothetical protein GH714_019969 [Hevea brasiliensis]|uniref:Uncharacterized protein n=1 Tax=Hevea brasiliensis TaxID=3981 RepID=A0A6A6N8W9_HEVBR|nr:hypothetical protein GH714_019969 [Hevea brasiliensis]
MMVANNENEIEDEVGNVAPQYPKELQKRVTIGRNATFAEMVNNAKELEATNRRMDDQKELRQGVQKRTTFEHGGLSNKKGKFQATSYHQ